jgi:putative sugar O-methyltransferase
MSAQQRAANTPRDNQNFELKDDSELLDIMLADARSQPSLYQPGPYWEATAQNAVNEIKRCGIQDFRGSTNLVAVSYADTVHVDIRDAYNHGFRRLARWLTRTYPLSRIFESQLRWTESYAIESIKYAQEILNLKRRTRDLLNKYTVPYSLLGDCQGKAEIDGQEYSILYLDHIEKIDNLASRVNFTAAYSVFEIGPGFGANIHLLLENYKNIKKVLYLDIPPNLYVGTQYLKAFYGAAVSDYRALRQRDPIKFSENDDLEILCIAPWQIERFEGAVDVFTNSCSFVEMPTGVVKNYVDKFNKFPESINAAIALIAYDHFDSSTIHPSELPKFFIGREFDCFEVEAPLKSLSRNLYFVSPGKLAYS